ncbi:hypothetical protein EBT16_06280 [bacterium]|nr:hypothetical protein [bacterium]
MNLKTAINEARKEATSLHVTVKVVKAPAGSTFPYFPCRREWLEGAGQEYKLVAEAYPNGKVVRVA